MSMGFLYRCEILVSLAVFELGCVGTGGGGSGREGGAQNGCVEMVGFVISWTWSLKRTVQPMIVVGLQNSSGAVGGGDFFRSLATPRNHAITRV